MDAKHKAFSQFRTRMENKYGSLTDQQASSVLQKLVTKQQVGDKDLREAEEEIKLFKTPNKLTQARTKFNNYKTIEQALQANAKAKHRHVNNSTSLTIRKEINSKGVEQENYREIGAKSEMKHRINVKSFANDFRFKFPKIGSSEVGSTFENHKHSYVSSVANKTTSDPFNKSVIVYSENFLAFHNKNLEEEKQKIRQHKYLEKKRMLDFLTKQVTERSKREVDEAMNTKRMEIEQPNALGIDDTDYRQKNAKYEASSEHIKRKEEECTRVFDKDNQYKIIKENKRKLSDDQRLLENQEMQKKSRLRDVAMHNIYLAQSKIDQLALIKDLDRKEEANYLQNGLKLLDLNQERFRETVKRLDMKNK